MAGFWTQIASWLDIPDFLAGVITGVVFMLIAIVAYLDWGKPPCGRERT